MTFHLRVTSPRDSRLIANLTPFEAIEVWNVERALHPNAVITTIRAEDGALVSPMYLIAAESGSRPQAA